MARDGVSFKVEGFRGLEANLDRVSKGQSKAVMRKSLKEAAQPVADAARADAPEVTGDLKESIGISTRLTKRQARIHRRGGRGDVEVFVGAADPQAHLVEFGSENNSPKPFMRPAWDTNKQRVLDILVDRLWTNIERRLVLNAKKAARDAKKAAKK